MRTATLTIAALILGVAALPTVAFATDCPVVPQEKWMTIDQVKAKGADLGYDVKQVKTEDGCYELYALKDGKRFEVYLHPATGDIVEVKSED